MGITVTFSYHAAESQTQFLAWALAQLRDFFGSVAAAAPASLSLFCRGQHLAAQKDISKAEFFFFSTPVVSRKLQDHMWPQAVSLGMVVAKCLLKTIACAF